MIKHLYLLHVCEGSAHSFSLQQINQTDNLKTAWSEIYEYPVPEHHRFPMLKYGLLPLKLLQEGILKESDLFEPGEITEKEAGYAHDSEYISQVFQHKLSREETRRIGFEWTEKLVKRECTICQGTYEAAMFARKSPFVSFNTAGGTHHAGLRHGEGFCVFNDVAVAIRMMQKNEPGLRFLVLDLDVHQGNGTAEIFENDPNVFTVSVHGQDNFPFRKSKSDMDVGLPSGTSTLKYLEAVSDVFNALPVDVPFDMVFYNAGVDILASDKLGKLKVSPDGCQERDYMVFEWCKSMDVPVIVTMGGGYSPRIEDVLQAHVNTFRAAKETMSP